MKIEFEKGPLHGQAMYTKAVGPEIHWSVNGNIYKYVYRFDCSKEPMGPNSVLHFECKTPYEEPPLIEVAKEELTREEKISKRMKEIWEERRKKAEE